MRNFRLFSLLCILLSSSALLAQVPESSWAQSRSSGQPAAMPPVDCSNQDAGSYDFTNGRGSSNDLDASVLAGMPDRLFLCKDDSVSIRHRGGDLSGDPRPSSTPGFGYAIYSCLPTVSGPNLNTVITDCVFNDLPNSPVFMVTQGGTSGDVEFFNACFFQNDPRFGIVGDPKEIWFAPITFDSLTPNGRAGWEVDPATPGSPAGPCVDVNVTDAFSVVYLNPISLTIHSMSRCQLRMVVDGGLPEWDNNEDYTVRSFSIVDNSIEGEICGGGNTLNYGDTLEMYFPTDGLYRLELTDGKGCPYDTIINVQCEPTIVDVGPRIVNDMGATVCIPFTVQEFTEIISFQLQYGWDPAVMRFIEVRNINPIFPGTIQTSNPQPGVFSSILFDLSFREYSLPDGAVLFDVCFELIGNPGDCTDFALNMRSGASEPEISSLSCVYASEFTATEVCITPNTTIDAGGCSSDIGLSNGSIIFGPTVGTGPFSYEISQASNPGVILRTGAFNMPGDRIEETGFAPGTYLISITDAAGVMEQATIVIAAAARLNISSLDPINPTCFNSSDGSLTANISGGINPYQILWSTSDMNVFTITNLTTGRYTVVVEDANGCVDSLSESLFKDPINVQLMGERLTSCPGDNDGIVFAEAMGGNGPYRFDWNSGQRITTGVFSDRLTGSTSGTVRLEVTDQDGCAVISDTFRLESLNILNADVIFDPISCNGNNDGAIRITPNTGMGPYTYDWNDIGLGDSVRSGLGAGRYEVIITDAGGCFDTLSYVLNDPDSVFIAIDSVNSTPYVCDQEENGQIFVDIQVDPSRSFTINWSNGLMNTQSGLNLPAGNYQITIVDEEGCSDMTSYTINSSDPIEFTLPSVAIPDCPGDSTYLRVTNVMGGSTGPYMYRVNNGPLTAEGDSVSIVSGTHFLEVFDAIGCSRDTLIVIGNPDPISISLPPTLDVELGDTLQRIVVDVRPISSRDSIVSYQWSPAAVVSCDSCYDTRFIGSESTVLTVLVTDINGCSYEASIEVRVQKVRNVYVPNAFTPYNDDGINDRFMLGFGRGVQEIVAFQVFNRWGDLIYERQNIPVSDADPEGWDGTYRNKEQAPGVYVFRAEVRFSDGEVLSYKGDITLLQ